MQNSPGFSTNCRTARDLTKVAEQPGIFTQIAEQPGILTKSAELEPWLDTSTPDPDTIPTLPRHYPDTIPTPRHSDTSVNRHSVRHSDTSVRPVSSHLDVGHQRLASSSVNGVKAKPTLRHSTPPTPPTPPTLDTPDTPTLQASMLTRCRPRC